MRILKRIMKRLPVWETPSIKERMAEMADEQNSREAHDIATAAGCLARFETVDEARAVIDEALRRYGIEETVKVRVGGFRALAEASNAYCAMYQDKRVEIVFTDRSHLCESTALHEAAHAIRYCRGFVSGGHDAGWRAVFFALLEARGYKPRGIRPEDARDLARKAWLASIGIPRT